MINGEGIREDVSGPTSPDPFQSILPRSLGGDSPSSQYSSCGGGEESESERFCSANNSIMGTPSLSSSFGPLLESEFGSMKSLVDGNFENFSLSVSSDSGIDCFKNDKVYGESSRLDNELDAERTGERSERHFERDGGKGSVSDNCVSGFDLEVDGEGEMEREGDGRSSRYKHSDISDDDDSMYGCGSEEENRKNVYIWKSGEAKVENENPLLINSSVAFGSEDWDDFDQETGGGTHFDMFQKPKNCDVETERKFSNVDSVGLINVPAVAQIETEKDLQEDHAGIREVKGHKLADNFDTCSVDPIVLRNSKVEQVKEVEEIPPVSCQVYDTLGCVEDVETMLFTPLHVANPCNPEQKNVCDISVTCSQVQGASDMAQGFTNYSVGDVIEIEKDPPVVEAPMRLGSDFIDHGVEQEHQFLKPFKWIDDIKHLQDRETGHLEAKVDPLSDTIHQIHCRSNEFSEKASAESEDQKPDAVRLMLESNISKSSDKSSGSMDFPKRHPALIKADNLDFDEFYDDIVNDMQEILLESSKPPGVRFPQNNLMFPSQLSLPPRDGGSTASTSGTDDAYPLTSQQLRIDGVEVIGAKQKKGDVSLSERLVGVKEYTVYIIRVWSGKHHWEVERRYRDFFTLYRRLRSVSMDQGWTLPSLWLSVEKESRKIFGSASPDVVSERSVLIQECLRSLLHPGFLSGPPSALIWFLHPQDSFPSSPASKEPAPYSMFDNKGLHTENFSTLGKKISLIVEIRTKKSMKQILEAQQYTCAGCHRHFDDGMTLMRDFVQTLGWGKPRLCEYTGQLFCSSCHTNEIAVLPARVLHYWDFTQYPISQLAKSYLDSIHEQPMLCVSAVNPFLFSRVPALHHVMSVRKGIATMLPFVRCPFRRTIHKGLGSRKYLLESNDFFALKDLIDLSKGAFAALPVMVETVSRKILEHITEQCLVCCDVGVPCSARQACDDPSSLIFPFQEGEIERCPSCGFVFHKPCFRKLANCSCGAHLAVDKAMVSTNRLSGTSSEYLFGRRLSSGLPVDMLSRLFSKARPDHDVKDRDTVILMGSLPSTSL